MKKLVSTIALLAVVLAASSSFSEKDSYLAVGDEAPELSLNNSSSDIELGDYKGEYVLLTFWSSADAASRADLNRYTAWMSRTKPENVKHISVNFDSEKVLFDEIVKLDGLDQNAQFNVQGSNASQIISDYSLQEGFGTVLISPDGLVKEFNPSISELSSLI